MATVIHHVQQPTDNTCMCAVLAMITTIPVDVIMAKYHVAFTEREKWYSDVLRDYNVPHTYGVVFNADIMSGFGHILTVPSLNVSGDFHGILVLWPKGAKKYIVLDPNRGRPGKRFYVADDELGLTSMGHPLVNWRVDLYIPLADGGEALEVVDDYSDH